MGVAVGVAAGVEEGVTEGVAVEGVGVGAVLATILAQDMAAGLAEMGLMGTMGLSFGRAGGDFLEVVGAVGEDVVVLVDGAVTAFVGCVSGVIVLGLTVSGTEVLGDGAFGSWDLDFEGESFLAFSPEALFSVCRSFISTTSTLSHSDSFAVPFSSFCPATGAELRTAASFGISGASLFVSASVVIAT